MEWAIITIQWLHVFLGIFWFGSVLYLDFVVIPAVTRLPLDQQGTISQQLARRSNQIILPVASLVIIIGFLRGTFFGAVTTLDSAFGTAYGITFILSLVLAIAVYAWGYFVTRPAAERINKLGAALVDGKVTPEFTVSLQRVRLLALIELFGFFAVFTCMILMRFGF